MCWPLASGCWLERLRIDFGLRPFVVLYLVIPATTESARYAGNFPSVSEAFRTARRTNYDMILVIRDSENLITSDFACEVSPPRAQRRKRNR